MLLTAATVMGVQFTLPKNDQAYYFGESYDCPTKVEHIITHDSMIFAGWTKAKYSFKDASRDECNADQVAFIAKSYKDDNETYNEIGNLRFTN